MILWLLLLAGLWTALQAELSLGTAVGGLLAAGFSLFWLKAYVSAKTPGQLRIAPVLKLAGLFLKDLIVANLLVLRECVRPRPQLSPAVIIQPVPLESDLLMSTLANLVTLTPGTLSLEALKEPPRLVVHGLFVSEEQEPHLRQSIVRYAELLSEVRR